jgi:hypothetical protein
LCLALRNQHHHDHEDYILITKTSSKSYYKPCKSPHRLQDEQVNKAKEMAQRRLLPQLLHSLRELPELQELVEALRSLRIPLLIIIIASAWGRQCSARARGGVAGVASETMKSLPFPCCGWFCL